MVFGYCRVSSKEQNLSRQLVEIGKYVEERNIYCDKKSGKDFDRENYQILTRKIMRENDSLIILSLDRLGRNYDEMLKEWKFLTNELKCHIKVLDCPILDTTNENNDLTNKLICDIVLNLLSYVAENERTKIRERQRQGIDYCLFHQGEIGIKHYGRPKLLIENFDDVYDIWKKGEITAKKAQQLLSCSKSSFYRLVKNHEELLKNAS